MEQKISNFEEKIITSMQEELKNKIELPEYKELLLFLHTLLLMTGRADMMFCNAFLQEATQLLKNSIFLYKDGIFDCAFYSIRQASEVINSMLYLATSPSVERKKWSAKEYFPMDSKLKALLEKISDDYKEIKLLLPEYFSRQEELIKMSHKIIHKQGFDTFYQVRKPYSPKHGFVQERETELFLDALNWNIF